MTTKAARLEFRLEEEAKSRIERAAKLASSSVSGFVVEAATAAADKILARADVTIMPASQFDEMLAALDQADAAPALRRLAEQEPRFVRK